jgi:sialic acid synthase SpsE
MLWNKDRTTIIAEIGTNHEGSLDIALDLIKSSAKSGADIVKFQSFIADELISKTDQNYFRLKSLEIKEKWYPILIEECQANNVHFLSTATSFESLDWMEKYNVLGYKVASANISHTQIIDKLIEYRKPIILSTGMATFDEISQIHKKLQDNRIEHAFLHCVSKYPAKPKEMNLGNIEYLKSNLECEIGFSDHSLGDNMSIAAVSLGAKIIEKHVTADKNGKGMDNDVSLIPEEFKRFCSSIRETENALKVHFEMELSKFKNYRRSLHFANNMSKGSIIQAKNIITIRPETGIKPEYLNQVLGKKLIKNAKQGDPILWDLVE